MQRKANGNDSNMHNLEFDEELAGVLTAISVVSKRLAKKLLALQRREESTERGGTADGQD